MCLYFLPNKLFFEKVKITVNDEKVPNLHMKLGDQGEAFFVQEMSDEEEGIPSRLMTSPIHFERETKLNHGAEIATELKSVYLANARLTRI